MYLRFLDSSGSLYPFNRYTLTTLSHSLNRIHLLETKITTTKNNVNLELYYISKKDNNLIYFYKLYIFNLNYIRIFQQTNNKFENDFRS